MTRPGSKWWHIETIGIAGLLIILATIAGWLISRWIG